MESFVVRTIKKVFGISNLTLFIRRKKQDIEKLFYHKEYTADDIINALKNMGVKPGKPLIVHSAMHNFYNYRGTAEELIYKLIDFLGPDGTLCMPAFPIDKYNTDIIFDSKNTPSAAGYLTEVFRKMPGVKRSLNQLHSVCALGKDADRITGEHHMSKICFDEHSPFYIIGELGGYSVNLGMPKWYIGTGEHVCEAILYEELQYFKDKFTTPLTFRYKDVDGRDISHTMLTKSRHTYVRRTDMKIINNYLDKSSFGILKLSNIWVSCYNMKYLRVRLTELAKHGIVIYKAPKFYL